MVKLILPNSAPPGQESQKCLENSTTDLVTSRRLPPDQSREDAVVVRLLQVGGDELSAVDLRQTTHVGRWEAAQLAFG